MQKLKIRQYAALRGISYQYVARCCKANRCDLLPHVSEITHKTSEVIPQGYYVLSVDVDGLEANKNSVNNQNQKS